MPTTRSSTSKATSVANASTSFDLSEESSVISTPNEALDLRTLMLSIQANQKTIEAINSRLTEHSDSIAVTSKTLLELDSTVQAISSTVLDLPKTFDIKIETIQEALRSDMSNAVNSLGKKFYQDLSAHHIDTTECFKTYATTMASISTDVLNMNKTLTTLQDNNFTKPDIERLIVEKWQDELDPHIQSHYEFKQETTNKLDILDKTIQDTIDGQLRSHPLLQGNNRSTITRSSGSTGFHQPTSKDFSVFKLQKELKEIKLYGDSLKELETFWDAILRAFTNLCQSNQAYPYYRDLKPVFSFQVHFVDSVQPPRFLPAEHDQAKRNYKSFGDAVRIFLQSGTTILETSSPKTYLKLLSLSDIHDGFVLLRDLIFSLSPQLAGDYHDYRFDIDALGIIPGEHISKFYQRVLKLSTEITLSNISNGNMALLAYRFIFLLRAIQCPMITGLLTTYWKEITKHRRDPNHLTKPLPWSFKDVYDDLVSSDVQLLQYSVDTTSTTPLPFAARGVIHHSSPKQTNTTPSPRSTTISIHRTRDGRKFLSHNNVLAAARRPTCLLCSNKHANPWHPTENCPYKHPTHILPKDIRERVMQHNALHGAEKKDYTRDQDLPTMKTSPPQAASAITPSEEKHNESSITPLDSSTDSIDFQDDNEIIDTEYFDLPLPPPTANLASTSDSNPYKDIEPDTVITDPLQYLSYES
jgi:hypothetical protein